MSQAALPAGSVAGAASAIDTPRSENDFRQLLESLPAAIYATDAEGHITFFNRAAAELAGREPVLGSDKWCVSWRLYRPDGTPLPHDECPMAVTLKENRSVRGVEILAERPDGTRVPLIPCPTPIRDASGKLIGAVNMLVDISEQKQSEAKLRTLMHELNHRVKNNMQMLQSLVGASEREATNPEARDLLASAARRIGAMAAAQQGLYSSPGTSSFDVPKLLESLGRHASQAFGSKADIHIDAGQGELPNEMAMPIALIINELVSNAVKHGRADRSHVSIKICLVPSDKEWTLSVIDDGPGFVFQEPRRRASGLGLVMGLARQLGGNLEITSAQGAQCVVRFARPRRD